MHFSACCRHDIMSRMSISRLKGPNGQYLRKYNQQDSMVSDLVFNINLPKLFKVFFELPFTVLLTISLMSIISLGCGLPLFGLNSQAISYMPSKNPDSKETPSWYIRDLSWFHHIHQLCLNQKDLASHTSYTSGRAFSFLISYSLASN